LDYVIGSLIFNNKLFRFQYFRYHTIDAVVFIKAKHILRSTFRLAFSPPLTQILGMGYRQDFFAKSFKPFGDNHLANCH